MDNYLPPDEPQERRKPPVLRIALIVAGLLLVGCIAVIAGFSVAFHRSPIAVVQGHLTPTPEELFGKDRILVLVEGLDYDYTDKDEEFSSQARSDVIKAVDLDFRTNNVYVLDVPRDMDAIMPNGRETKINQAQADGGVREAQAVIARWLGIPGFDRYVTLRVNTTKDLINAIGGVNVDVMNSDCLWPKPHKPCPNGPLNYDDSWGHLHIHLKPGMQHLNGDQAVGYARFRHDWCGDPCRIERQDQVMHAALAKLKSDKFNTLMHLGDILNVFNRDVDTNLTHAEELSLATTFAQMPKNGLHTAQIHYVDTNIASDGGEVIIPDTAERARLVRTMLLDPPVPTPSPAPGAVAAISPASVHVDVENGSGVPGAARRVASLLQKQGFVIGEIGNAADSGLSATELHEHSKIEYAGLKVRQALGKSAQGARVIADSAAPAPAASAARPSDVTVIVGEDLATALAARVSAKP